jgi:hypothetical protein
MDVLPREPKQPTVEEFLAYREAMGLADDITLHQVTLWVYGGINEAYFWFNSLENEPHYPAPIASVYTDRYQGEVGNFNGPSLHTFQNIADATFLKMKPFEYCFHGPTLTHDKPVYTFGVSWLLPHSLRQSVSLLSFRNLVRKNSATGVDKTPSIKLYETFLKDGQIAVRMFYKDRRLTAAEMKAVSFPID